MIRMSINLLLFTLTWPPKHSLSNRHLCFTNCLRHTEGREGEREGERERGREREGERGGERDLLSR